MAKDKIERLLAAIRAKEAAMSPAERAEYKAAEYQAQRESWVRSCQELKD